MSMKTRNLAIISGIILSVLFIPIAQAQVGDQNGIPPTESLAGILVGGVEYLAVSYDDVLEIVAGDNITLDLDNSTGTLMINSTSLYRGMGDITYFNATVPYTEVISAISDGHTNTYVVAPPTVLNTSHFFDMPSDGRLRYTGEITTDFHIGATFSVGLETGTNDRLVFSIHKNGVEVDDGQIIRKIGSTNDLGAGAIHVMTELQQNDYIELYVGNMDATDNVEFHTLNIFALGSKHGFTGTQFGFLDSIHTIGNVTNTGCAEGEILSVQSGIFDCATAGAGGGEANTASNLSPGEGLFTTKSGVDLPFKSLAAGNNIILNTNATTIEIESTGGGGGGETNTASNLNPGEGIFSTKVGSDLQFKSLINGSGILLTSNSSNIMINSTSTRDQINWTSCLLNNFESTMWLGFDGECYIAGGSINNFEYHVTKPTYLDYIEFKFSSNNISSGQYTWRVLDNVSTIAGDFTIDMSTISAGDTVRQELDVRLDPGDWVIIDGECTTAPACSTGTAYFSATLELYAIYDANDYPGWTYQDDNLGNHNATTNIDMNENSIQNAIYYEADGIVANSGSVRLSTGDAVAWRNVANTGDLKIGYDLNDFVLLMPLEEYNFSQTTLDMKGNDFNNAVFDIAGTGNILESTGGQRGDLIVMDQFLDYKRFAKGSALDVLRVNAAGTDLEWATAAGGSGGGKQTWAYNADPTLTVAKGNTIWLGMGSASSSTEADVDIPIGAAGTINRLICDIPASNTNAGSSIWIYKNGLSTSVLVQPGAGATGTFSDLVNSFSFNQDDKIDIRVKNPSTGGGAKDLVLAHCSFLITYD